MYTLITILTILVCAFMILIVLVQNAKGGGFASGFSASNQIMGVRKSADFLEKLTWGLAICLLSFSLLAGFALPKKGEAGVNNSELKDKLENYSSRPVNNMPALPKDNQAPAPAPAPEKK